MSLITDVNPLMQPEGTYPFGLNLINSTKDNAISATSSEPGTALVHTYPTGYEVIGKIYFDNKVLVFSTDDAISEIGIIENDRYRTIYAGDLGFKKANKILGQHRTLKGCEDVFYFQDGINPDRYFNLNDIPTAIDGFEMLQIASEPEIKVVINNTGGTMPSGGVSFQLRYNDLEGNVFDTSNPTISYPVYTDTISSIAQGSTENTQKSATLTVSNIDIRFPYIKLIAIHNVEGNYEAYEIDNLIATDTELVIEYQGPTANDIRIDNRDVQVGRAVYNNSLVSEQVLGRLLRANVQEIDEDYSTHQRLVNDVVVLPEITQIPKSEFAQDPETYNNLTFQSDEVYALGLRFTDSTLVKQPTPVYHIPGRADFPGELDEISFNGEIYRRYQIQNTAEDIPNSVRGMGYYRTSSVYPNIKDCNGNYIFGNFQGKNVRHHRMPSRRTVALEQGNNLQSINLTLDNVTIPEGWDGYEMFYVPRTDANSTVLDSGYLGYGFNVTTGDNSISTTLPGLNAGLTNNTSVARFMSPRSLLEDNLKGNYFDYIRRVEIVALQDQGRGDNFNTGTDNAGPYDSAYLFTRFNTGQEAIINEYLPYDKNVYIQPNSFDGSNFNFPVYNTEYSNAANVYEVEYDLPGYTIYGVNKRIASVNNNLQSLIYKPLIEKEGVYKGDTFLQKFELFSIFPDFNRSVIGSSFIRDYWVESKVNNSLFHGEHFPVDQDITYVVSKLGESRDIVEQEEYNYNLGYGFDSIKSYFPLPLTYDYCNRCRSKNPTRIIYSPQSFQEELSDQYLIANSNDYIDLPSNTGPITGLKYKNNRLYVHTTQTTYVLTPNPQYLSTNQAVAQLQTGDFLSVPPQEIIQADHGYGGMHDKTASVNCEFGYFWVDGLRGSLNSIEQSFNSVSNNGMMSWFKNNLTVNSTTTLGFDPYFSRIIMTTRNTDDLCQPFHTLSYSLLKKSFTSFHSHNPDFYLNNSTTMYKGVKNKIRKQTKDELFDQHEIVIEQVTKSLQTQNLMSLTHYTEFFEDGHEITDTFDELVIYNSNQSTGTLRLFLGGAYSNVLYNQSTRPVTITDKNHNISNLYDNAVSKIVTRLPCAEGMYTDKVFINTDTNSSAYDRSIFKEKYTIARLTYKPTTSKRMTHYLLHQNKQQSIR